MKDKLLKKKGGDRKTLQFYVLFIYQEKIKVKINK